MDGERGLHEVYFKNVLVKMSDGSLIQGKVNTTEQHRRLSDWFRNDTHPFIVVVSEESPENPPEIFIINKSQIAWVKARD